MDTQKIIKAVNDRIGVAKNRKERRNNIRKLKKLYKRIEKLKMKYKIKEDK